MKLGQADLDCYESLADYGQFRRRFKFWVEGVAVVAVGFVGLLGNAAAVLVLRGMAANSSFNKLLTW